MKFVPVDPSEVENIGEGARGKVSYPILKGFMETGLPLAKVDRGSLNGRSPQSLVQALNSYIRSHDMPIKLFQRQGELYLARTDLNLDGTPKTPDPAKADLAEQAQPLTPELIQRSRETP